MSLTPEQRKELVEYLVAIKCEASESNARLEGIMHAVHSVAEAQGRAEATIIQMEQNLADVVAEQRLIRSRLDMHGKRIRTLEARVQVDVDPAEITGVHNAPLRHAVNELAKKEDRRDSYRQFIKRQWVIWVFGLAALLVAGCGGAVATAVWHYYVKGH